MIRKALRIFTALMLGFMISSCEKIEPVILAGEPINIETTMEDIPLRYGRLVSATTGGPFRAVLWFEQSDQTIVGVAVNFSRGTINEEVIKFERR